jgi:hypothetical protein
MVIAEAKLEGWEPNPPPSDWTEGKPVFGSGAAPKPVQNRFERPMFAPTPGSDAPAVTLPPRTIGSKIPINRRHKKRR